MGKRSDGNVDAAVVVDAVGGRDIEADVQLWYRPQGQHSLTRRKWFRHRRFRWGDPNLSAQ